MPNGGLWALRYGQKTLSEAVWPDQGDSVQGDDLANPVLLRKLKQHGTNCECKTNALPQHKSGWAAIGRAMNLHCQPSVTWEAAISAVPELAGTQHAALQWCVLGR
eukprot:scaffold87680_cov20-Tisochrysis_lutea.AAC.1